MYSNKGKQHNMYSNNTKHMQQRREVNTACTVTKGTNTKSHPMAAGRIFLGVWRLQWDRESRTQCQNQMCWDQRWRTEKHLKGGKPGLKIQKKGKYFHWRMVLLPVSMLHKYFIASNRASHKAAIFIRPLSIKRLSLIHIWRCRRAVTCRSRWSPYH